MKQQHHPKKTDVYSKGADRDAEKELESLQEGTYLDANNMRTADADGDAGSVKKLKGETLFYPNIDNRCNNGTGLPLPTTYKCTATIEVNQHLFEIWADTGAGDSYIRIDGQIVLMSPDFPATVAHPFQWAKNESCIGGEVYLTDFFVSPMFFNVLDLLKNSGLSGGICTEKYFSEYNIKESQLSVTKALDHPVFIKLDGGNSGYDAIVGAGDMTVGYYAYSTRLVTAAGDRTAWSTPTPQIPMIINDNVDCSPVHPRLKSVSAPAGTESGLGIHIRVRINNDNNFDFIELRRDSWNLEDPIGLPAISEIVAKVDILNGQVSVMDILDKNGFEETLSQEEVISEIAGLARAKAIRYFNNRLYLMNIEYGSKDITDNIDFLTTDDDGNPSTPEVEMFPTVQKMGTQGHGDPYHHTYHKGTATGEKHGYAIIAYDEQGENTYAIPIPNFDNYQYPNRRDPMSAETRDNSYFGTVKAANTNGVVSDTHEVLDNLNAIAKGDLCSWANIVEGESNILLNNPKKDIFFGGLNKYPTTINPTDCGDVPDSYKGGFPYIGYVICHKLGFKPFKPTSQLDDCEDLSSDGAGAGYRINPEVTPRVLGLDIKYEPKGFGIEYFANGMAMKGLNKSTLPSWVKAFSIVKTESAGRVVAQGMAHYSMQTALGALNDSTTKKKDEAWFYSPDLDPLTGIDPDVIADIQANSSNYGVQVVSPLGFFTEVYNFDNAQGLVGVSDGLVDMVTYHRIVSDKWASPPLLYPNQNRDSEVNPHEHTDTGIVDNNRTYVGYGKWRNQNSSSSSLFDSSTPSSVDGNKVIGINSITPVYEGRGVYWQIIFDENLWDNGAPNINLLSDNFYDDGVRDWHEPTYMINIIKLSAEVPDENVTTYIPTGHYQKLESTIGLSDGSGSQHYPLVDERWEDCIVTVDGVVNNPYINDYKFVYIVDTAGAEKKWVNVTNLSPAALAVILNDLDTNGSASVGGETVYGVYRDSETTDDTAPIYSIDFDWFDTSFDRKWFIPLTEFKIVVKYDNRYPCRFFGGDVNVGEAIFSPLDRKFNKNSALDTSVNSDEFKLNIPYPYPKFNINNRVFIVNNSSGFGFGGSVNRIQNANTFKVSSVNPVVAPCSIRQLCSVFTVESRINMTYAFNRETSDIDNPAEMAKNTQFFPLKNYIMRPNKWNDDGFTSGDNDQIYNDDNVIDTEYGDVYGNEWNQWGWGGFRFLPQTNIDYSKVNKTKNYSSVPAVGFEEQNKYCTRTIWSEQRPINIQDSPSVRTFPAQNFYDISDDTGAITRAFSAISGKGNNLYSFTENGICLLLIDKRVIHEINADELATVGSDIGGILNQLWISKRTGIPDEFWRSVAEFDNTMFFSNRDSSFAFSDNNPVDIGRVKYHSKLRQEYLETVQAGFSTDMTATYNVLHREYWLGLNVKNNDGEDVLMFGTQQAHWQGSNKFAFDQYLTVDNNLFGMRDNETYKLNDGFQMNGNDIECYVIGVTAPAQVADKEFIRIRVASNVKPTKIEFFNTVEQALTGQVQCELNATQLKDYFGYEQYIPRKLLAPHFRIQGRLLVYKIIHNLAEEFKVVSTEIQYKPLK